MFSTLENTKSSEKNVLKTPFIAFSYLKIILCIVRNVIYPLKSLTTSLSQQNHLQQQTAIAQAAAP